MSSNRVWRDSGTIPAALELFLIFKVNVEAGREIDVLSIAFNNDTRPFADPRMAFAWKGTQGDDTGDADQSMLLAIAHVSQNNDHVRYFPKVLRLLPNEQIGFKLTGAQNDSVNAKVMYTLVE